MTDFHEKKKRGLGLKVIFSWMHISSVRRRALLYVCEASGAFLGNNIGFRASCRCILIILLMFCFFISCASSVKMKDTLNTFWSHLETFCIVLWVLLQHSLAQTVSLDQKNINSGAPQSWYWRRYIHSPHLQYLPDLRFEPATFGLRVRLSNH